MACKLVHVFPYLVRSEDGYGSTALNRAVSFDDLEFVKFLLTAGSDPNHESSREGRPLWDACYFARESIAIALLDAGAEIALQNDESHPGHDTGTAFHAACLGGRLNMVELLINRGGDVNSIANLRGDTPLYYAISPEPKSMQRPEIVRLLLEHGAQVNLKDCKGQTPLSRAKRFGPDFDKIADILIEYGAQPAVPPEK
jgi:hypothetical protein